MRPSEQVDLGFMRRKIIAGNWKMNGNQAFVRDFTNEFKTAVADLPSQSERIIAPPSIYLDQVRKAFEGTPVVLAAQNVSEYASGAYTGEISAAMLQDMGVAYCLVGHSERRALFGDTDEKVLAKIEQLLDRGMHPILCVGETLQEREAGRAETIVEAQLSSVLKAFEEQDLGGLIVAYEPVWAIGTGQTATPDIAQNMHAFVRKVLAGKSQALAQACPVLYGGSVNAGNAESLFGQNDVDGGLVGGASLKANEFNKICMSMG